METYLLETRNLTKTFQKKNPAVKQMNMKVRRNTVYGLLGPNGAGKSTTLKMMSGIMRPTGGQILFDGHPWSRADLWDISALIENPPLYENLTAEENLKVKTTLFHLPAQRRKEVLELVELGHTGKKCAKEFSLGMKQRLGIALALLNHPKLLILDEPTNGLDPLGIKDLRRLIRSFADEGITVILSSHILSEVEQVADDIGILTNGVLGYQEKITHEQDLEKLFLEIVASGRGEYGV